MDIKLWNDIVSREESLAIEILLVSMVCSKTGKCAKDVTIGDQLNVIEEIPNDVSDTVIICNIR